MDPHAQIIHSEFLLPVQSQRQVNIVLGHCSGSFQGGSRISEGSILMDVLAIHDQALMNLNTV